MKARGSISILRSIHTQTPRPPTHPSPIDQWQGAVIRELEDELRVQQSPAYRAHAHKAILVTELLRLVQV